MERTTVSKEEWRKSMLFNCPDEVALEAKLDRIKQFKKMREESAKGTKAKAPVGKAKVDATLAGIQRSAGIGSDGRLELDSANRFKAFKSREALAADETNQRRRRTNGQREQMRRLPDYLAPANDPPPAPYVLEYKAAVSSRPRGQATIKFEEAADAAEFAAVASGHASAVAKSISGLPEEVRAVDNGVQVASLTTAAAKVLSVDRALLPPLEFFELADFVEKDKPPEEWLADGPCDGAVPYWRAEGSAWDWAPCQVLGYHEGKYEVQIKGDPGGQKKAAAAAVGGKAPKLGEDAYQPKWVSRLNLRFESEDPHMFEQRRRAAQEGRQQIITSLRFDKMVTTRDIPQVSSLETSFELRVHPFRKPMGASVCLVFFLFYLPTAILPY